MSDTNRTNNTFSFHFLTHQKVKKGQVNDNTFGSVHWLYKAEAGWHHGSDNRMLSVLSFMSIVFIVFIVYVPTHLIGVHVVLNTVKALCLYVITSIYPAIMSLWPKTSMFQFPIIAHCHFIWAPAHQRPGPSDLLCDALLITCSCFVLTWILDC